MVGLTSVVPLSACFGEDGDSGEGKINVPYRVTVAVVRKILLRSKQRVPAINFVTGVHTPPLKP